MNNRSMLVWLRPKHIQINTQKHAARMIV